MCAKNYQIQWRFDEVLTKTNWVIFWPTLYIKDTKKTSHINKQVHLYGSQCQQEPGWIQTNRQCEKHNAPCTARGI